MRSTKTEIERSPSSMLMPRMSPSACASSQKATTFSPRMKMSKNAVPASVAPTTAEPSARSEDERKSMSAILPTIEEESSEIAAAL